MAKTAKKSKKKANKSSVTFKLGKAETGIEIPTMSGNHPNSAINKYPDIYKDIDEMNVNESKAFPNSPEAISIVNKVRSAIVAASAGVKFFVIKRVNPDNARIWREEDRKPKKKKGTWGGNRHTGPLKNKNKIKKKADA